MPLSVLAVLLAACSNEPGPATAPMPAGDPHRHDAPAALDEVAVGADLLEPQRGALAVVVKRLTLWGGPVRRGRFLRRGG